MFLEKIISLGKKKNLLIITDITIPHKLATVLPIARTFLD